MNIGINDGYEKAKFKDVEIGKCFLHNHTVYIKVRMFFGNDTYIRAVNVETGEGIIFLDNEPIELLKCSVVIDR